MMGVWIHGIFLLATITGIGAEFTCIHPAVVARKPAVQGYRLYVPPGYSKHYSTASSFTLSHCAEYCQFTLYNCLAYNFDITGECDLLSVTRSSTMSEVTWEKHDRYQYQELFCLVNSCQLGRWGADCSRECHSLYGACNQEDGVCDRGYCIAGYTGHSCNVTACRPSGSWGASCQYNCHCAYFRSCRQSDGYCYNGCGTGWIGTACNYKACRYSGAWGSSCQYNCHCGNYESCRQSDGYCYNGCGTGWIGSACNNRNCSRNNGFCVHDCHQDGTTRSWCTCRAGYALTQDGRNCTLDECTMGTHTCSASNHEVCVNTPGSYTCQYQPGYILSQGRTQCQDVDECNQRSHNCTGQYETCYNTQGGFRCDCTGGYHRDSHKCVDTDECSTSCTSPNQVCTNSIGSYSCSCTTGYIAAPDSSCSDIDECTGQHNCTAAYSQCVNTDGSYRCVCEQGYTQLQGESGCTDSCLDMFKQTFVKSQNFSSECEQLSVLSESSPSDCIHAACLGNLVNMVTVGDSGCELRQCKDTDNLRLRSCASGRDIYVRTTIQEALAPWVVPVAAVVGCIIVLVVVVALSVTARRRKWCRKETPAAGDMELKATPGEHQGNDVVEYEDVGNFPHDPPEGVYSTIDEENIESQYTGLGHQRGPQPATYTDLNQDHNYVNM